MTIGEDNQLPPIFFPRTLMRGVHIGSMYQFKHTLLFVGMEQIPLREKWEEADPTMKQFAEYFWQTEHLLMAPPFDEVRRCSSLKSGAICGRKFARNSNDCNAQTEDQCAVSSSDFELPANRKKRQAPDLKGVKTKLAARSGENVTDEDAYEAVRLCSTQLPENATLEDKNWVEQFCKEMGLDLILLTGKMADAVVNTVGDSNWLTWLAQAAKTTPKSTITTTVAGKATTTTAKSTKTTTTTAKSTKTTTTTAKPTGTTTTTAKPTGTTTTTAKPTETTTTTTAKPTKTTTTTVKPTETTTTTVKPTETTTTTAKPTETTTTTVKPTEVTTATAEPTVTTTKAEELTTTTTITQDSYTTQKHVESSKLNCKPCPVDNDTESIKTAQKGKEQPRYNRKKRDLSIWCANIFTRLIYNALGNACAAGVGASTIGSVTAASQAIKSQDATVKINGLSNVLLGQEIHDISQVLASKTDAMGRQAEELFKSDQNLKSILAAQMRVNTHLYH